MVEATISVPKQAQAGAGRVIFIVAAVFLGFMAIGVPLPVLPIFVHDALGYSGLIVGWVVGAQSVATLLTRPFAGGLCDRIGPRHVAVLGLLACALSGIFYAVSSSTAPRPLFSLASLFAGRAVLGLGESLLITGALAWGIGLAGPRRTAKVMSWTGIAMYGALAVGATLGTQLFRSGEFITISIAAAIFPLVGMLTARGAQAIRKVEEPAAFVSVVRVIWRPGTALAFATIAFGGLAAFLPLLYASRHWSGTGVAFGGFGTAYVLIRLLFGGLPDRIGGRPVAIVSLLIEIAGQTTLWLAGSSDMAAFGAALTGCGFSLVFPALGILAMKRAASNPKGITIGAYVAFFDLSLALTGPAAGLVVAWAGYPAVFLVGAFGAATALLLTLQPPPTVATSNP